MQIKLSEEECAEGMEVQNYVVVKDVQIKLREEECALRMGQSANDAAVKDARIELSEEECAAFMGQIGKIVLSNEAS